MSAQPQPGTRPRGRPRLDIHPDAVADAVAELIAEGGLDAVSIFDAAEKLSVSRATLYRSVPTKEHLLAILLERSMDEISADMERRLQTDDPAVQLVELVKVQTDAAVRMRRYMTLFFGGGGLPPDVYERWQKWIRDYENTWVKVVKANMAAGDLPETDPVITARLLLGACIWVSRWYRPNDKYSAEDITRTAVDLISGLQGGGPRRVKSAAKPAAKAAAKPAARTRKRS